MQLGRQEGREVGGWPRIVTALRHFGVTGFFLGGMASGFYKGLIWRQVLGFSGTG